MLFTIEEILVGRRWESSKHGDGIIIEAIRRGNADAIKNDEIVYAYAICVRPDGYGFFVRNYWQTIYIPKDQNAW
jgi:hypothetical protein